MRAHPAAILCLLAPVLAPAACSDPVRDRREAEVGPEDPEGPSENHRRGQDCLLCHSEEGGAQPELVVAGTIYQDQSPDSAGAENVEVEFVDATRGGPLVNPVSFASGNFFVPRQDWPRLTFPFKVRIKAGGNVIPMLSTVNREGSCNFCHRPNPAPPYTDEQREAARRSIGQIYVSAEGAPQ